jgi:xanthosine utilization system XapX-like protein
VQVIYFSFLKVRQPADFSAFSETVEGFRGLIVQVIYFSFLKVRQPANFSAFSQTVD